MSQVDFDRMFPKKTKEEMDRIAMPWISDSGNDFGLSDPKSNRKKLEHYLENKTETLEENDKYEFFLFGSWTDWGYLIKYDKKEKLILYYCKFQVSPPSKLFPHIVTQTEVWRALNQVQGMAKKFLLGFLYEKFGAVMSDKIHTPRGEEFWRAILATAEDMGLGIAVVGSSQITPKTKEESLNDFFKRVDTWKSGPENKERETQIQFMFFDPKYLQDMK